MQDEQHWYGGYLYHNATDPRLLVPWRGGRGYVFNCAKPLGLLVTGTSIVLPIAGLLGLVAALIWLFSSLALAVGLPVVLVVWRLAVMLRSGETAA